MACRTKSSAALAGWWLSCAVIIPATHCSWPKDGAKAQDGGQAPKRDFPKSNCRAYQQDFGKTLEFFMPKRGGRWLVRALIRQPMQRPGSDGPSSYIFRLMHPGGKLSRLCFGKAHRLRHNSTSSHIEESPPAGLKDLLMYPLQSSVWHDFKGGAGGLPWEAFA